MPAPAGSGVSPVEEEDGRRETAYMALLRNKKSIAINLQMAQGRDVFLRLARKSDVILEGFRPGVVKRLGVDYETVSKINPQLVYCSLSGYGQDGPYRDLPGHDPNYIGIGGAYALIGNQDGPPVRPLNLIGDYAGGSLMATIGILLALVARQKTGRGQYVDISMTDGVVSLLSLFISNYFMSGKVPRRGETLSNSIYPGLTIYQTKDGDYIALACFELKFWENLCRTFDREDFIPFQWAEGQKREEMKAHFQKIFLTKTRKEWFDFLKSKDICASPVYELDEVFSDPQILHRQMLLELDHPTEGKVKQVGIPIKLSETPGEVKKFGALLGEHTDEILLYSGYTQEEIAQLRHAKAVQ